MSELKSIDKTKLTPVQAKVAKAKIEADLAGKSITEVAPTVFPNSTPEAARVSMSRTLQNATVQEVIAEALAKAGLTADTLAVVVADAVKANKVVQVEGDFYETEVPDHGIRLKAVGMAAQWLGVGKGDGEGGKVNINFINVSKADKQEYGIG